VATRHDDGHVVRYRRLARWFHTASYLVIFVLLGTGWWLRTGQEGRPSLLARALGLADVEIHRRAGWVLVVLVGLGVTVGVRGAWTFVRETLRVNRGDGRWFLRWPIGVVTGRFAKHRGHFDPGQRLLNVGIVASLGTLIVTGVGLTTIHSGSDFVLLARLHRGATYVLTALVVGHVVVAIGVLPGYRGVWRSMHLRGRTPKATVKRLWPASVDAAPPEDPAPAEQSVRCAEGPTRGAWPVDDEVRATGRTT
jgi:formate dehydrogenase subunit gamma